MPRPINAVRYLIRTLQEIALLRLIIVVVCLIAFGAVGLWITEPQVDVTNALWWSIVTLTTVGYGDISPTTTGGRLVGAVVMVLGIGVLGAFTGQVASLLTERRRLKDKGLLVNANLSGHLIFSSWGPHARSVYDSIRADPRGETQTIVLIADREESPVPDDLNFIFVQGKTDEQTLSTANIESADTFIAFGDPRLDEEARDAKVVLHLLTVETINPDVHTIAEVELRSTIEHCRRAKADEVIVGSEFTSHLLSRASLDHGISNVLSELMDPNTGMELFKVPMAQRFVGENFGDVLAAVKKSHDCLLIGVETRTDAGSRRVLTNPPLNRTMSSSDTLILMGRDSVRQL